jgi:peptidylprolyl isomerase
MQTAQSGNTVRVHYRGTLDDGTEFDCSAGRDPLEFTIGSGQVIPGFDQGVTGMGLSEKKTVTIPAAEAYGEWNEDMVFDFPRSEFPEGMQLEKGMGLQLSGQNGEIVPVLIVNSTTKKSPLTPTIRWPAKT